jgi:uncharacterized membrane protein YGL010W
MKTMTHYLADYAAYHRDRRNIVTHFIGIPLIVLGVAILLSRPEAGLLSPAVVLGVVLTAFYLRLDWLFGAGMAVWLGLTLWAAAVLAGLGTGVWAAVGFGALVAGWVSQFIGHWFEGRKPAFLDDVMGLAIGRSSFWRS